MTHSRTSAERSARTNGTVAALGAGGTMGFAMARNIARAGLEVRAWNRSRGMARRDDADHPTWLQMSTMGEEATQRCMSLANSNGIGFVDAPVLGTRQPAEQGQLAILESGAEEAWPMVQPVFDAIGHWTIRAGQAGAGSRLKLVTNSWVLAVVEAGAETIALAEGLGLDPSLFFRALEGGALDLPYLRMKGQAIANRDFAPSYLASAPGQAA